MKREERPKNMASMREENGSQLYYQRDISRMKPEQKKEHRRGEMPDELFIIIETFVSDVYAEFEKAEGFDIRRFPMLQRTVDRTIRDLMREEFHKRMKERPKGK